MKSLRTSVSILSIGIFILALTGCKTSSQMQCPDLASVKKPHQPLLALNYHHTNQPKTSKPAEWATNTQVAKAGATDTTATASADQSMHFKIKMPNSVAQNMQTDQDVADMNKVLASYSNNKVALQRNDQGKLFLKAHSVKDIFALAQKVYHPQGYYERRYGNGGGGGGNSGAAVAAGVLGPISFLFAFLPFLSFAAIPIGIAAIITGAIGLRSPRQRMATIGLVFGILGLIIGIFMSLLYIHLFFAVLILF